jgi:hypothetical protein
VAILAILLIYIERRKQKLNNNEWIEINTDELRRFNKEVMDRVSYVKIRCLGCGKTFGVNPRSDGKVLEKDLTCRDCQQ